MLLEDSNVDRTFLQSPSRNIAELKNVRLRI